MLFRNKGIGNAWCVVKLAETVSITLIAVGRCYMALADRIGKKRAVCGEI